MAGPGQSLMNFAVTGPQFSQRLIAFQVVSEALTQGKFDGSISGTGGTYTIVFNEPFARAPEVAVTCVTDNRIARVTSSTAFQCVIETQNLVGGAAAASDFHLLVHGSDAKDAIR